MVPTDLEKCLNFFSVWQSAWFFNLPWKLAIFLEKCLKMTFLWKNQKNNGPRNLSCLCVFYAFCTLNFEELRGSVILSSTLSSLVIRWAMFSMLDIVIRCMESYFITEKYVYNTPDNDSIVLGNYNFVLDKSLKSPWISYRKKCANHILWMRYPLWNCPQMNATGTYWW